MDLAIRIAALLLPLVLGVIAERRRIFAAPDAAIAHLNLYALYVAFPALVFTGIADARFSLPTSFGFYALVPIALLVTLGLTRLVGREHAGTIALVVSFGNVAYLGLPLVARVLGEDVVGLASLAVAIHVSLSMLFGPALLLRWSGKGDRAPFGAVLRQPLTWAPFAGLAARALPEAVVRGMCEITSPLGGSAAPVAMFLLGLYLHRHRGALRVDAANLRHVALKVVVLPLVSAGLALGFHALDALSATEAQVLVVLAAMPAAISTFAIAERFGVGERRVCEAVVTTTIASALTLPLVIVWARFAF